MKMIHLDLENASLPIAHCWHALKQSTQRDTILGNN
jgi:hypothetical protein